MATEFKLSYTASDINERLGRIDNLAKKSDIPSKLSELTNDSGFTTESYVNSAIANIDIPEVDLKDYALKSEIPTDYLKSIPSEYVTESELNAKGYLTSFTETDPTVPAWAKAATKPTYTASEVGALPANTVIPTVPTNVSAFVNDAGYLTEHQSLEGFVTQEHMEEALATKQPVGDYALKSEIPDVSSISSSAIIDVTELPTENIREDAFYRVLSGSLVINQVVQNAYTCHCVETLPSSGLPATNLDQTEGHIYYTVGDGELYGYVDDMLSMGLGVPVGWYPGATLLGALGFGYSGVITNIMDDPKDGTFRLLIEYVVYSYKDSWTSHKPIGWAGIGPSSVIFNDPMNIASGEKSHAEGSSSHAEGYSSHAEGDYSHAEGDYSHAEGSSSHAEGCSSHAEGCSSHAEGDYSHAEGYSSHAEGHSSHAEGYFSHAEGYYSHAEGDYSHAEGRSSHAEGHGDFWTKNITGASASTVYTINDVTYLNVGASIRYTISDSKGVPTYNTAKIVSIDAINKTITVNRTLSADAALNNASVLVYVSGLALGDNSHSEGNQTIAAGRSQHTQGEFNIIDPEYDVNNNGIRGKYAHIVGNGTAHTSRSNAHTLDWSGNAWFQGEVYIGGTSQDDSTAVKLAKISDIPSIEGLASKSYVDTKIASLVNSAPEALNTLGELAAALGDDSNFATTVTNQIASKQDAITGTAGQFVVIGTNGKPTTKTILIAEEATF